MSVSFSRIEVTFSVSLSIYPISKVASLLKSPVWKERTGMDTCRSPTGFPLTAPTAPNFVEHIDVSLGRLAHKFPYFDFICS